jgi:hypothetical protein
VCIDVWGDIMVRMADRAWRGYWWLPGRPEEEVPGTLVQREADGAVVLNLIGGFRIEVVTAIDEHQRSVSFDWAFPMILGTSSGERFTLLECNAARTSGLPGISEQDIAVQRALRGIHLSNPDEEVFDSADLTVEYLLGWTHSTTLEASAELNGWKWTGNQTATTNPIDDMTAVHGGYEYTLSVLFNQFRVEDRPRANERSLVSREWAQLTLRSASPTTFGGFDRSAKAIMDLMTLAAHAPAGVIQETVQFTPPEPHPVTGQPMPKDVEVMGQQIHHPRPAAKETARIDYLFTLADIDFSEVLPSWLDLHEQAWLACNMLFGLSYIPEGYTASRLLTAATAAESLHRALYPDATRIPPCQFKTIRQTVMDAVADDKAARQFLSDSLYNEITYKERLQALAALPDPQAVAHLISDLPKWAKYVKEQRNGLAHGDRERLDSDSVQMVFATLEVTKALLGLVLLRMIGLSNEVQRRAANLLYLSQIVREFNRALPNV